MKEPGSPDNALMSLVRRIAAADTAAAVELIGASPALARAFFQQGAARQTAESYHLARSATTSIKGIRALHIAATAYLREVVKARLAPGADVGARNRRGAEPLHAASSGRPGSSAWKPQPSPASLPWACRPSA
jgi:hypothetical protein